jgi:Coenzyme PQQ synthesis protein D (PqqD)
MAAMTRPDGRWPELEAKSVSVPAHVAFRDLAQETVLLNISTGQYHGIDRIGARFFNVMREVGQLSDAPAILAAEFEQPADRIQTDLAAFCDQLLSLGLIELHPARS